MVSKQPAFCPLSYKVFDTMRGCELWHAARRTSENLAKRQNLAVVLEQTRGQLISGYFSTC